uniref:WD_REPEATS_REGION domain-containing protein n=1 Tax=Elaeophora elaphi TaxID=1147741 RepID=A0A0R3RZM9_9BILA
MELIVALATMCDKLQCFDKGNSDPPLPTWFQELRHVVKIVGINEEIADRDLWHRKNGTCYGRNPRRRNPQNFQLFKLRKYSKERMRTVSVALVLCLNIGVDPPDVHKPNPCARKECWIDPLGMNPQKAVVKIGNALQKSYERWQPRARYKTACDPTMDDVRRLCQSLRRNAKEERILFHYNGHGVPRPTENGEIWVFNKNFTQYIPLSIFDLQSWMGHPAVYVWDCHCAGLAVKSFFRFAEDHEKEWVKQLDEHMETRPPPLPIIQAEMSLEEKASAFGFRKKPNFKECIHVGACGDHELLPMDSRLPADLFTSCILTPIQTSVLWYILKNHLEDRFPVTMVDKIPGQLSDRRTMLGELNWIFTAITDTIAWSSLPKELFQKLFRLDLLVASVFRSFVLANRVMRENQCHVVSCPSLPSVHSHPLWDAWDYTIDLCLSQMQGFTIPKQKLWSVAKEIYFSLLIDVSSQLAPLDETDYTHNWFFIEQLQAFEVWLKYGGERRTPPQQLPVVLQVLLSQVHRVKALELLARFLDLGSWAVGHALSVGVFPYVLKLLQSAMKELRPWLAFIWAKILAVETDCQVDLIKDKERGPAQELLTDNRYVTLCIELLSDTALRQCRLLRLWLLIGLGRLWADYDDARWQAIRLAAYERVLEFLDDSVPEVRAAAVYAIGCLVRNKSENIEHATIIDHEVCDKLSMKCTFDGSVLVRAELVVAMQWFIIDFENRFASLSMDLNEKIEQKKFRERKLSAGEQEMKPLRSIDEEDDSFVSRGYDRSLPRSASRRRTHFLEASLNSPRRSNSMNFVSGVVADKVCAQWKSVFDANSLNDFSTKLLASTKETRNENFKNKAIKQIEFLGSKTFNDQSERIWLSLLRLSLDPVNKIAEMAQVLIEHVDKLATTRHERKKKLNYAERTSLNKQAESYPAEAVTFTVGSPTLDLAATPPFLEDHIHRNSENTLSLDSRRQEQLPVFHQSAIFTPKRNMYSPTIKSMTKLDETSSTEREPVVALVTTEFVPWCTRRFTEPILDVIQGEVGDGLTDRLATHSMPSDWASHKDEGLRQTSKKEIRALKEERLFFDGHPLTVKTDAVSKCLAWSQIRPHLYSCDGEAVTIWRCESQRLYDVRKFLCHNDNPFVNDIVTDLHVINEMTRELLMTCSEDGLMRIWDPGYSIYSHDFETEQQMITAAYLLKDAPISIPVNKHPASVFSWNQKCGLMAVSGNVKVCRLWDAHAEKTMQEIQIGAKNCAVTKLSLDNSGSNLLAVGLSDGLVNVYDPRLPEKSRRTMSFRELEEPVIGLSLFYNLMGEFSEGNLRLIAGSRDGEIRLWEPRMFKEPVVSFNACSSPRKDSLTNMEVHTHSQCIGCMDDAAIVKLFDVNGKHLGEIRQDDWLVGGRIGTLTSMRFHQLLVSLAVATENQTISFYRMPDLSHSSSVQP